MDKESAEPKRHHYAPDGSHLDTSQLYWQILEKRDPVALANLTLCEPGPGIMMTFRFSGFPVHVRLNLLP